MQFVHVSKDALPQKAQGGFVTASLAALILAFSSSASLFFFFNAAASLHAVLWADQLNNGYTGGFVGWVNGGLSGGLKPGLGLVVITPTNPRAGADAAGEGGVGEGVGADVDGSAAALGAFPPFFFVMGWCVGALEVRRAVAGAVTASVQHTRRPSTQEEDDSGDDRPGVQLVRCHSDPVAD